MTKLNLIESDGAEVEKTIKIFSVVFILILFFLFLADKKSTNHFCTKIDYLKIMYWQESNLFCTKLFIGNWLDI